MLKVIFFSKSIENEDGRCYNSFYQVRLKREYLQSVNINHMMWFRKEK